MLYWKLIKEKIQFGHIRMETTNVNPAEYLGFGTWVFWGAGRVPVGIDTSDSDFKTAEKTGGEKTHKLTTSELPKIEGEIDASSGIISNSYTNLLFGSGIFSSAGKTRNLKISTTTVNSSDKFDIGVKMSIGGDTAHNNLQPYITCYMWKRMK